MPPRVIKKIAIVMPLGNQMRSVEHLRNFRRLQMPENWSCEVCKWLQISCENEFHFSERDYTAGCDNIDYGDRDGRGKNAVFSFQ